MGALEFITSVIVLLLIVAVVMIAAVVGLVWLTRRRLQQKNQVSALAATEAPNSWAVIPAGPGAGQHRRLQRIAGEARAAAQQAGGISYEVGDAAHDIESQAVDLDRQVVATSRMAPGPERAKRYYALDQQIKDLQAVTHKLTDLSLRFSTSAASPEATRDRLAAIEASLSELDTARAAADQELAALNRPLQQGVQAQMEQAQRNQPQPQHQPRPASQPQTQPQAQPQTVDLGGSAAQAAPPPPTPKPTPRIRGRY